MPDARKLIDRGIRLERGGVLEDALQSYVDAAAQGGGPEILSEALRRQADILRLRCEWDRAILRASEAEVTARDAGLDDLAAEAMNARAAVEQSRGHLEEATALYGVVLDLCREPRIRGCAMQNLGALSAMKGEHGRAAEHFEGSLECFRNAGYERGIAIALNNIGRASLDRGNPGRAEEVLGPAVAQARQIEDLELASVALVNLAEALLARDEYERAEEEASAALGFFKVSGNLWRQVECVRMLGDIRRDRGETDIAGRLYGQALAVAEQIGASREAEEVRSRLAGISEAPPPPPLA